jgi:hypothetical protein
MRDVHLKSTLFSLIGRPVQCLGETGIIVEKYPKQMLFRVRFGHRSIWLLRADFILPPLPENERRGEYLNDDSGFAYEGVEGF